MPSQAKMLEAGFIDAVAAAIHGALLAHGITSEAGYPIVHEQCTRLCKDWGGESHWVPQVYRPGRDALVLRAVQAGSSVRDAAQQAGIHPDTVRRILQRQSAGLGRDEWVL